MMYLDYSDVTPPAGPTSGKVAHSKTLDGAKREALALLANAEEGQIGIYKDYLGDFLGYAIKYRGQMPYFEEATN